MYIDLGRGVDLAPPTALHAKSHLCSLGTARSNEMETRRGGEQVRQAAARRGCQVQELNINTLLCGDDHITKRGWLLGHCVRSSAAHPEVGRAHT